jgi:hypothetical protein
MTNPCEPTIEETFEILAAAARKDRRKCHRAKWSNYEDDDGDLIMEIDLGDDRSILFQLPKDKDEAPVVDLMHGHGWDATRINITDSWNKDFFRLWLEPASSGSIGTASLKSKYYDANNRSRS